MFRFIAICVAMLCLQVCSQPSSDLILIEAEGFEEKGGWVVDAQFIDQMGSPYLLAHGMGEPVADARTCIEFRRSGRYRVFVRTYDWCAPWDSGYHPGRFRVVVAGDTLPVHFGTEDDRWMWQDGGNVDLSSGEVSISIHDMSGFDGRCDAILFSLDPGFVPPDGVKALDRFRHELLGSLDRPRDAGRFDLVVVGGGMAGTCAAIAAARLDLQVALVQNRPVLGGNYSSEIRVHLGGDTDQNLYPALGAVVRELDAGDPGNAGPADAYGDDLKLRAAEAEPNISLFLNNHVNEVEMDGERIRAVLARHVETGEVTRYSAPLFADCTGDGNLGYLAGADFRYGREGRGETDESMAPEEPDSMTLGSSNLWYAHRHDTPSNFPECPWAVPFSEDYYLEQTRADWRWESGFFDHTVDESELIRDRNLRAIYGNWAFLKNHRPEEYSHWKLDWVAYVTGKRESRRLSGDIILTQQDIQEQVAYPDACVTTTWSLDLHFPDPGNSEYYPGEEFYSWYEHPEIRPYHIPYRCLYSRNISNLFMAGRNISVTHVALGTVRVMRTGGMMGEVVGMAAAVCIRHDALPREVYHDHLQDLIMQMQQGVGFPYLQ